jgi:hypothetical protein
MEWEVGLAFLKWPAAFIEYGVTAHASDDEVGAALAQWLAEKNNGHSQEWNDSVRRHGIAQARREWEERYTHGPVGGTSFVSRLRRTAARVDPMRRVVPELSEDEGSTVLQWGESHFEAGATRYRFECWAWAAMRWLKKKCLHELRGRGRLPICSDPDDPLQRVDFELPARTAESWPFGSGRDSRSREARYGQFRDVLQHKERWMEWSGNYYNPRFRRPNAPSDIKGKARSYCFVLPNLDVRAGDLPLPPS